MSWFKDDGTAVVSMPITPEAWTAINAPNADPVNEVHRRGLDRLRMVHQMARAEWDMGEGHKGNSREDLFRQARREVRRQWRKETWSGKPGGDLHHIDYVLGEMENEVGGED